MPTKFDRMVSNWGDLAAARSLTLRDLFGVRQQGFHGVQLMIMPISGYKNQSSNVGISVTPGDILMGGMSPWLILERLGKHKTFFSSELFANNLNAPILFVPNFVHASKSQDVHYITGFNRKSHDPFMFLYDPERKGRIYFDDGVWRHDEHMKSS